MRVMEETSQLFEWRNIHFHQLAEEKYKVTAECMVLVSGEDPRALPWNVLAEAFQIEKGDQAEIEWEAPIVNGELKCGDVLNITVMVTIRPTGLSAKLKIVQDKLEELNSAFVKCGNASSESKMTIQFASLQGMCIAIQTQLDLMQYILEQRAKG